MRLRTLFSITIISWLVFAAIWAIYYVTAATASPSPAAEYEVQWEFQLVFFVFRYGPVLLLALCLVLVSEYILVATAGRLRMGVSARLALCAALLGVAGAASYLYSLRILSASLFQCVQAGRTDAYACHESAFYRLIGITLSLASGLGLLIAAGLRLRRGGGGRYAGT